MAKIGFIGLGNVGAPMCHRLVAAGHEGHVFDLEAARVAVAVNAGAYAAASAVDCAAAGELLLTSLPRPESVQAVMVGSGALAALPTGSVWVDLTTNRVDLLTSLADRAPDGVLVIDCPVTGAVDGARNGRLTLFAGGDPTAVKRVAPVLATLGTVIECGPLGTGTVVKLVTNQLWFIHAAALGEGFALGLQHGVGLETLWRAIRQSVGDSFVAAHDAPSIFAGHYDPSFTLDLCLKDLGLIEQLQADLTADLPMTDAARCAFSRAADTYGIDAAELHVARLIEDQTGLSFRLAGNWTAPWEVTDPQPENPPSP